MTGFSSEGYQVVEPACLQPLGDNEYELNVLVIEFILERLRKHMGADLLGVTLTVIPVEYISSYPAIGVRYHQDVPDVGPRIETIVDSWMCESLFSEFLNFVRSSPERPKFTRT